MVANGSGIGATVCTRDIVRHPGLSGLVQYLSHRSEFFVIARPF